MPTETIPLIGQITQRGFSTITSFSKDQYFSGVVPSVLVNSQTGKRSINVQKRGGWTTNATPGVGNIGTAIFCSPSSGDIVTAFGATTSTVYTSSTSIGTLTTNHLASHISETVIGGVTYILISAVDRSVIGTIGGATSGWYYPANGASILTTSYTGTLTSGSAVVPSIASTAGMYAGQLITGTGIPVNTRIQSVDSSTQITMTANATANGAQTITKEPIAKIIDTNFPTAITGQFVDLDGYVFIMDQFGKIWNSTINTVATWSALGFKSADTYSDNGVGLAKDGHVIWAFGNGGAEAFYNAGYQTGSPLEKTKQFIKVGAERTATGSSRTHALISDSGGIICWISSTGPSASIGTYIMDGGGAKKISTPPVDAILASGGTIKNISCWSAFGHKWVHISKPTAINLLYCVDLDIWVDGGFPDAYITTNRVPPVTGVGSKVSAIEAILTNGRQYDLSATVYQDAGSAYSAIIQTGKINHGTDKRKFISEIRLISDEQSSGTVTLEYSDDDYGSWVTLGTFDLTAHEKKITRCGSHKGGRAYRLTHSTAAAFSAEALAITYTAANK